MQAVVFERPGDPHDVLRVAEVPSPEIPDGHVLVGVQARPIQPADRLFIRGVYRIKPKSLQVAGLEGAGVVLDGAGTGFAAGTRVAFRWPGTWAERAVVPVHRLIPIPDEVPDSVACQISLNPITAWALLDEAGVRYGDYVILTAGASTVSKLAAAIARQRGVRTIAIVRGSPHRTMHSSAQWVLSVQDPDLVQNIAHAAGENRVAAILDSVGGPLIPRLFPTLKPGARVVAYGVQEREPAQVTNAMLVYSNLTWMGFGIDRWLQTLESRKYDAMLAGLWAMVRSDTLSLPVHSSHSLDCFGAALSADAAPTREGKVLIAQQH